MKSMNKWRKILNERGFTLIEMMIVMLVISVLLIITVPSIVKNQETVNKKGCEAYIKMVEGQIQSYKLKENKTPSKAELISGGYIKDGASCPGGNDIVINADGSVEEVPS